MSLIKQVELVKLSICDCGHRLLADDIPLGTKFLADFHIMGHLSIRCGGCGKAHLGMQSIGVNGFKHPGEFRLLPREVFKTCSA